MVRTEAAQGQTAGKIGAVIRGMNALHTAARAIAENIRTSWHCRGANAHDLLEQPQPTLRGLAVDTRKAQDTLLDRRRMTAK